MAGWGAHFTELEVRLFTACSCADPDRIERALADGARANILDADGCNALHALADARFVDSLPGPRVPRFEDCTRLLLRAGVSPSATELASFHRTPAQVAADCGNVAALVAFSMLGFSLDGALRLAAKSSPNLEAISFLISAGCDPRVRGPGGLTAVEDAARRWGGPLEGSVELLTAATEALELRASLPEVLAGPARRL